MKVAIVYGLSQLVEAESERSAILKHELMTKRRSWQEFELVTFFWQPRIASAYKERKNLDMTYQPSHNRIVM